MKIFCEADGRSLFDGCFLTSDTEQADLNISVRKQCKKLGGRVIQAYNGQVYYQVADFFQFHLRNERVGCVLGETKPPFFDITVYCDHEKDAFVSKMMQEVVLQLARYRFLYIDSILLHASVVVSKNTGIGFIGHSGAGKSTQSMLWTKYRDAYVLNDDKPLLHFENDRVLVSGTPWSGKGNYYLNETHELKALCIVEQSDSNKIVRLSEAQAYSYIYLNNLPVMLNEEIEKRYENMISRICQRVPIYLLKCLPDRGAVVVAENEIFGRSVPLMRIKSGFVLRKIADEWLVIAKGENALHFNSTILLNETSAFLWDRISSSACSEEELLTAVLDEYDVGEEQARSDVRAFVERMYEYGVLEEM